MCCGLRIDQPYRKELRYDCTATLGFMVLRIEILLFNPKSQIPSLEGAREALPTI